MAMGTHFFYGALMSCVGGIGILTGKLADDTIGFLFYLGCVASFLAFHFLSRWVDQGSQRRFMEALQRAEAADYRRESLANREPIELVPAGAGDLSSLRRKTWPQTCN